MNAAGRSRRRARGVSLVEAMVALAVMAIGLLGVVGLQATLRANADVSRQRSEAVRIAQERLEILRGYRSLDGANGVSYESTIATAPGQPMPTALANTEFTLYQTVTELEPEAGRAKMVELKVAWRDRRAENDNQWVDFATFIAGTPPDLSGALFMPGNTTGLALPGGRHPAIPSEAELDEGGSTSTFRLPDSGGVSWVFNNLTGVIVSICMPSTPCVASNAYLLSGYVRFATGQSPTPELAEVPPSLSEADQDSIPDMPAPFVTVQRTGSPLPPVVDCLHRVFAGYVAYYCAVPLASASTTWSGRSTLQLSKLATLPRDDVPGTLRDADKLRVCRYTPMPRPPRNIDHPLDYVDVVGALTNQNFLVISAGDGSNRFACPDDDPDTAPMTKTLEHQPEPEPVPTTTS
ncbi:type IV pilus modification PilV family protein [Rubrivivax gelatinosus]|uniref:Tfp pilus assembly protein PilV n=1 Tax=Rubrivivax gelatinosus TaxID=28068 RepID=A0A4V6NPV6_RUBGE|nr:prepilin-type N-terminal cleavage/methylation domain-containing protein [Rubrivivax gelatinosus]TCO98407.1 Tfp pilus assembly protein PilV [Rubrivivax gelatinosus]